MTIKKLLTLFISLLLVVSFTACDDEEDSNGSSEDTSAVKSQIEKFEIHINNNDMNSFQKLWSPTQSDSYTTIIPDYWNSSIQGVHTPMDLDFDNAKYDFSGNNCSVTIDNISTTDLVTDDQKQYTIALVMENGEWKIKNWYNMDTVVLQKRSE